MAGATAEEVMVSTAVEDMAVMVAVGMVTVDMAVGMVAATADAMAEAGAGEVVTGVRAGGLVPVPSTQDGMWTWAIEPVRKPVQQNVAIMPNVMNTA
jgi:hypothetical protein